MNEKKPFSLLLVIFVLACFCSYHIYYFCLNEKKEKLVDNYYVENKPIVSNSPQKVEKINIEKEDYAGILIIPKIKLKLGVDKIDSKKNDISQNIKILEESLMPDIEGGTIYFAAHSGDSYISFFKNLGKLSINDEVIINYNEKKYHYIVNDIYEMNKTGKILVNKNVVENYVVLTTCSKNKNKQLIVTGKLFKVS